MSSRQYRQQQGQQLESAAALYVFCAIMMYAWCSLDFLSRRQFYLHGPLFFLRSDKPLNLILRKSGASKNQGTLDGRFLGFRVFFGYFGRFGHVGNFGVFRLLRVRFRVILIHLSGSLGSSIFIYRRSFLSHRFITLL